MPYSGGCGPLGPGSHTIEWNATGQGSRRVASGTYFMRIDVAGQSRTLKLTLLK